MKPYHLIVPVALICSIGTAHAAFTNNNQLQAEANKQLGADAMSAEAKASAEDQRKTLLAAIATEAINSKPAIVVFDRNEQLIRTEVMPKEIAKQQFFTIGYKLPASLKLSSVGIYNLRTGEYAAIGILNGQPQILAVYTTKEVEKAVTQVQNR